MRAEFPLSPEDPAREGDREFYLTFRSGPPGRARAAAGTINRSFAAVGVEPPVSIVRLNGDEPHRALRPKTIGKCTSGPDQRSPFKKVMEEAACFPIPPMVSASAARFLIRGVIAAVRPVPPDVRGCEGIEPRICGPHDIFSQPLNVRRLCAVCMRRPAPRAWGI
jgi:hypothetical protein